MTRNDNACCQRQVDPEADQILVHRNFKTPQMQLMKSKKQR